MGSKIADLVSFFANLITLLTTAPAVGPLLKKWGILDYQQDQVILPFLVAYQSWLLALLVLAMLVSLATLGWWGYCHYYGYPEPFVLHSLTASFGLCLVCALWVLSKPLPIVGFVVMLGITAGAGYWLREMLRSYWKYYVIL